jgi:RNA polymerase-binding transcription factor DksA
MAKKKKSIKKTVSPKKAAKTVAPKKKVFPRVVKNLIKKTVVKSCFSKTELAAVRKKLVQERARILQDVVGLKGDCVSKSLKDVSGDLSGYSFHMADMATDLYDREFSLGLAEGERERLYALDEALKKISDGTYGVCEICGQEISKGRLKVMPHARYCIKHQEEQERGLSGR